MDSVVGAMTLAYYCHLKHDKVYVPIINAKRENFDMKLEIIQHLNRTLLKDGLNLDFMY